MLTQTLGHIPGRGLIVDREHLPQARVAEEGLPVVGVEFANLPEVLHDRPQLDDRGERGRAFDLWQHDPVDPRADDCNEVAVAELGVGGIYPNIEERLARQRQRRGHGIACGWLLRGRDRVFEVENDRIGIERQCICHAPGMIARRKQKTA
jgi:hypothetical protein